PRLRRGEGQGGQGDAERRRDPAREHDPPRRRRPHLDRRPRRGGAPVRGPSPPGRPLIMRIALGCDHRGYPYKLAMLRALAEDGHEVVDLGSYSTDPVDYPDYARLVGVAVRDRLAEAGILICGSGAGVSIAANKIRGVRAALCHDLFTA